jgi:hypothetical protein
VSRITNLVFSRVPDQHGPGALRRRQSWRASASSSMPLLTAGWRQRHRIVFRSRSDRLGQARLCPFQCIAPFVYRTRPKFAERRTTATRCLCRKCFCSRGEAGFRQRHSEAIARQKRVDTFGYEGHAVMAITCASKFAQL